VESACPPDERAGEEGPQVERRVVEDAAGLGVGGEEDLEAAVQAEAVHHVRADAAPDPDRGLEDTHRRPRLVEAQGAGEAGEARADHDHVRLRAAHDALPRTWRSAPSSAGKRKR
jgi:hypothetical protein